MKNIKNLDTDWLFYSDVLTLSEVYQIENPETITVPHTENVLSTADAAASTSCCYRKNLPLLKEPDFCYYLEFLGSAWNTTIYLNEQEIAKHTGDYTSFFVDITDAVVNGDNELCVHCQTSASEKRPDFLQSETIPAGLYREVNLHIISKTHFAPDFAGNMGLSIEISNITAQSADITLKTQTKNAPEHAMISYAIFDRSKQLLANYSVPVGNPNYTCHLKNPNLWNGLKNPYLYTAVAALSIDGRVYDQVVLPFGVRTFELSPEDAGIYFLNGTSRELAKARVYHPYQMDIYDLDEADESGMVLVVPKSCDSQLRAQTSYHPCLFFL